MKFRLIINKDDEEEIIVKAHSASELTSKIEDLVLSYNGTESMSVQGDDEILLIKYEDIECITIIDRKLFVVYKDGNMYRASGVLSGMEDKLPKYFIRINKSTIANERKILRFRTLYSGGVDAIFESGYKEYVSRRCFAEIKRRYSL